MTTATDDAKESGMPTSPIDVVDHWLRNLLDPAIVNSLVAPDATYVSLNTEDAELSKIMPWAGTSRGPLPAVPRRQLRHGVQLPQERDLDCPDRPRR